MITNGLSYLYVKVEIFFSRKGAVAAKKYQARTNEKERVIMGQKSLTNLSSLFKLET